MDQTLKKIGEWVISHDTGSASLFLACVFLGGNPTPKDSYPHDASDFGRCHRFLELLPKEYQAETLKKAVYFGGEYWGKLAGHWDELEELYYDEREGRNNDGSGISKLHIKIKNIILG